MLLFRWDPAKAARNKLKHGIAFEDAIFVLDDPFAISELDRVVEGESRWRTLGTVENLAVLFVAHTLQEEGQDEIVRIVSARRASQTERRIYEQNRYENIR